MDLFGSSPEALAQALGGTGRARAVLARLAAGADPREDATSSPTVRARLDEAVWPVEARAAHVATDGTVRLVLDLRDGRAIETVVIPSRARTTVCVSSQVGCARGCRFCETGTMGLVRSLDVAEIVSQVHAALAAVATRGLPALRNVVFMGMGEPLDNAEAVRGAIALLVDDRAYAFAPRHVTVSTVGPSVQSVLRTMEWPVPLAWSLHAARDEVRARLVPRPRASVGASRDAFAAVCARTGRALLVEMTLVEGVNDADADADAAVALFAEFPTEVRFNLLPMNPISGAELAPSRQDAVDRMRDRLIKAGHVAVVRRPRGRDERAACGQLVTGFGRRADTR